MVEQNSKYGHRLVQSMGYTGQKRDRQGYFHFTDKGTLYFGASMHFVELCSDRLSF